MIEYFLHNYMPFNILKPSILPFPTFKGDFHKVSSLGVSWALSFRGPWDETWMEHLPADGKTYYLTNGRIKKGYVI